MAKLPVYPLKQVLEVKKKRVKDQEIVVAERKRELQHEREKLAEAEAARDKVLSHYNDKLKQLRDELDHGTTTDKIQLIKAYLEVVKEKLEIEEKKVKKQQEQVEIAERNLEVAKELLTEKRREVDKLKEHRKEWSKEVRKELEAKEASELDEIGSIMFLSAKRKKK